MSSLPKLGPFRLQHPLAQGGMAMVWRAVHERQGHPVAIKIMTGKQARKERFVKLFHREVRAVARMNHPNIVGVFDYGEISEQIARLSDGHLVTESPYLVMELANSTLTHIDHDRLSWSEIHTILVHILEALAHAHARGLIHRDLKPDNVLFLSDREETKLKLSDFGVAYALNTTRQLHPLDQAITGTPRYMAPEQIRGRLREQGPWTDLYALGCLVYWLTTGLPPFYSESIDEVLRSHLVKPRPPLKSTVEVPRGFDRWAQRLLALEPSQRFRRAADAAAALRKIAGPAKRGAMRIGARTAAGEFVDLTVVEPPEATRVLGRPLRSGPSGKSQEWDEGDSLPDLPACWRDHCPRIESIEMVGVGLRLFELREIPLVDRHEHRDVLWENLVDARYTGRPHVVVLSGPEGMGKTRLANWLARRAHEVGAVEVLSAQHSPISGPADGLSRMFANHLRCVGLSRAKILERIRDFYGCEGTVDGENLYQSLALTELIAASADPQFEEGERKIRFGRPEERYIVWRNLLRRLGEERPLLLVLDDVHWGSDTLGFVRFLIDESAGDELPLLLVLTSRDDLIGQRPGTAELLSQIVDRPCSHHLEIGPLGSKDHRELVENLLRLEPDLAEEVARRTDGNPLFASLLVGDWVERGLLEVGGQGFCLPPGEEPALPGDVRGLLTQRLETLTGQSVAGPPCSALTALELGAVLGLDVLSREWRHLCGLANVEPPDELLNLLAGQSLVRLGESSWSFVHGALRETLLVVASEQGRLGQHHRYCAQMLEERYDTSREDLAPRLARHLLEAEDFEEAIEPLYRGFRYFIRTCDFEAAKGFFELHQQTRRRLGIADGDRRAIRANIQWARMHNRRRQLTRAHEILDECEELARTQGHRDLLADIILQRVVFKGADGRRDFDVELELIERARTLYEELEDDDGMARIHLELGWCRLTQKRYREAHQLFERARRHYETQMDSLRLARCIFSLAITSHRLGETRRAIELYGQAREIFEDDGGQLWVANCHNGLGEIYRNEGNIDEAKAHYEQAIEVNRRLGIDGSNTIPCYNLGFMMLGQGAFDDALYYMEQALKSEERAGRGPFLGLAHSGVAACMAARADWERYDSHLDKGRDYLADHSFAEPDLALAFELAGEKAAKAGEVARARRAYELALQQWRRLGDARRLEEVESYLATLTASAQVTDRS